MFQFKRIRTRLIFWFLILGLVPLIMGITANYIHRLRSMRESGYEKLMAIRDMKAEQIGYWLSNRSMEVKKISKDTLLCDLLTSLQAPHLLTDKTSLHSKLAQLRERYLLEFQEFIDLQLVVYNVGRMRVSTGDSLLKISKSRSDSFERAMTSGVLTVSRVFIESERRFMAFSIPVFSNTGTDSNQIAGVLQAIVDVDKSLKPILKPETELGKTGEIYLVNADGMAVSSLLKEPETTFYFQLLSKPAVMAKNGGEGLINTHDYKKKGVLAAFTFIPIIHWGLVVKQDLYEINQPLMHLLLDFILLLIFSVVILVAMASMVAESISRPIIGLANQATKIKKEDFEKISVSSKDEIGLLAKSFNEMGEHIQQKLYMQEGMSVISGSLVGSVSMNLFTINLLSSLVQVSGAKSAAILKDADGSDGKWLTLMQKWPEESNRWFNKSIINGTVVKEKLNGATTHVGLVTGARLSDLGINNEIFPVVDLILIPIKVDNNLQAIIMLISNEKFKHEVVETIEQTRDTMIIGYSNARATERLSIMASNLYEINQRLEFQTDELKEQSVQLKKTASELEKRNAQLEFQREQVESVSLLKIEFLSNMSHELRTPLHVILTLTGVIRSGLADRLSMEESEYLDVIERNGKLLLKLINDILDLSRIEAGKLDPVLRPVPLVVLLENVMANIQALAVEKELDFTLSSEEEIPMILSDDEKLYQVFQNIIGNAIKFTNKGFVRVVVLKENEWIVVKVIDSGIGMEENQQYLIFEEFRQIDGSTSRGFQGTGLGLTIARKTIELLGGYIKVKSKPGNGSTFFIYIPASYLPLGHETEVNLESTNAPYNEV
ncbi:MAG: ATP-binding protein [Bacteroidales bacterium]|nr:ATP-binding protein [Bacteroidales bacterium]